jgi:membrane protein DedA with SNARE-associated domain
VIAVNQVWLVFFGALVLGETAIIPAAALTGHGAFGPWEVAGWAYLGTMVADLFWFRIGRHADRYLSRHQDRQRRYQKVAARLDRWCGARPERALLFIKFVYGARLATIFYLSLRGVALRRFVAFTAVGAALWIAVIVTAGWLAGKGLDAWLPGLTTAQRVLPVIVILALGVRGLTMWLSKSALPKE